jgi:non-ribosomal peptide synthetase component F
VPNHVSTGRESILLSLFLIESFLLVQQIERMKLLQDLFREQAVKYPGLPAVSDGKRTLTYKQLDDVTDRLAAALQKRGAVVDSCVVIYMSKSIDYVISYIGILKAGAAYLPMDAAYPMEMVQMVLQDALPSVVIVSTEYAANVSNCSASVLELVSNWQDMLLPSDATELASPAMNLDSLAYVVYSSGTTGKPKGICCPHRGEPVTATCGVLQLHYFHSYTFY